jgi:hypothetical protein
MEEEEKGALPAECGGVREFGATGGLRDGQVEASITIYYNHLVGLFSFDCQLLDAASARSPKLICLSINNHQDSWHTTLEEGDDSGAQPGGARLSLANQLIGRTRALGDERNGSHNDNGGGWVKRPTRTARMG